MVREPSGLPPEELEQIHSDKRYLPRWDVEKRILLKVGRNDHSYECRSLNISCSGICLVMAEPLSDYGRMRLAIFLDDRRPLELTGELSWRHSSDVGHTLGIHFDNADEAVHQQILNHAFEMRGGPQSRWFEGWDGRKTEPADDE